METIWKFEINGTEVKEPVGWDAVILTMQRDPVFHGLENIFSDNIKFWDDGGALITAEYDLNGIDGSLNFDVSYSCDGGITFTYLFQGIINCFFYEVINSEVTAKIEPSGFHRKVKNRLNIPVNLSASTSIGGQPLSTINPFDLRLHSKAIVQESHIVFDLGTYSENYIPVPPNDTLYISLPFDTLEYEGLPTMRDAEPPIIYSLDGPSTFVNPVYTNNSGFSLDVTFNYSFICKLHELFATNRSYDLSLSYKLDNQHDPTVGVPNIAIHNYGNKVLLGGADLNQTVNETGSLSLTIPNGYSFHIFFVMSNFDNNPGSPQTTTITFNTVTQFFLHAKATSIVAPSTSKAFLIHEVFAKLAESITDVQDSFRSNFFGRTNSLPHAYDSNGCEAWTAITNGLNIRKMKDKSSNPFPMVLAFQEMFDAADAVWNLGMRIEKDNTGKEFIRIEPKEFFYNTHSIFNIFNVSNLKRYPAQDQIFNSFKTGYVKWNLNISGINGLDEFNSDRDYSIPVKNSSAKIEKLSNFIASGYLIEQCRRIQFQSNPTNDFELDNDLFFICTNRTSITSDKYSNPPVNTAYNAGTVSERDENFTGITNVLSPETCYNLRISPVRNAQNWYNYISASTWKHPEQPIKFINGTGNYQEGDTMINDCVISGTVTQNQNLLASNLHGLDAFPIYLPEYLEFTYPLSYDDFLNIMANAEKAIQVSCSNSTQFIGFIKDLKYTPTAQGGEGSFKLLRGACLVGDFNNDFNIDFFMGTCD